MPAAGIGADVPATSPVPDVPPAGIPATGATPRPPAPPRPAVFDREPAGGTDAEAALPAVETAPEPSTPAPPAPAGAEPPDTPAWLVGWDPTAGPFVQLASAAAVRTDHAANERVARSNTMVHLFEFLSAREAPAARLSTTRSFVRYAHEPSCTMAALAANESHCDALARARQRCDLRDPMIELRQTRRFVRLSRTAG